jgi:hypothetical protein
MQCLPTVSETGLLATELLAVAGLLVEGVEEAPVHPGLGWSEEKTWFIKNAANNPSP